MIQCLYLFITYLVYQYVNTKIQFKKNFLLLYSNRTNPENDQYQTMKVKLHFVRMNRKNVINKITSIKLQRIQFIYRHQLLLIMMNFHEDIRFSLFFFFILFFVKIQQIKFSVCTYARKSLEIHLLFLSIVIQILYSMKSPWT